jgi:hypothetical protein
MTKRDSSKVVFGVKVYPLSDILPKWLINILLLVSISALLGTLAACSSNVDEQSGASWTDGTVIIKPLTDLLPNSGPNTDLELLQSVLTMMANGGISPLLAFGVLTLLSILFGFLSLKGSSALSRQLIGFLGPILLRVLSLFRRPQPPQG